MQPTLQTQSSQVQQHDCREQVMEDIPTPLKPPLDHGAEASIPPLRTDQDRRKHIQSLHDRMFLGDEMAGYELEGISSRSLQLWNPQE